MGNTKDFSMSPLNYVSKKLTHIPTIVTHMQRKQTKFELKKMLEQFTLQERKKGGGEFRKQNKETLLFEVS